MNIHLVTDSTCDLPAEIIKQYNIHVVPLKVHFGEETYVDGVDITPSQFYPLLTTSKHHPSTSQPSPGDFVKKYQEIAKPGETIISVHISEKLSGTIQSALIAKNSMTDNPTHVVDSQMTTIALGFVVLQVAQAIQRGLTKEEILASIDRYISNVTTYYVVDTLEYLKRGGRIGKAQAYLGGLLNIKPILSFGGGAIEPIQKVRGRKKALDTALKLMANKFQMQSVMVAVMHTNAEEEAARVAEKAKSLLNCHQVLISVVGPVIGTHVGPGAVGISVCKL